MKWERNTIEERCVAMLHTGTGRHGRNDKEIGESHRKIWFREDYYFASLSVLHELVCPPWEVHLVDGRSSGEWVGKSQTGM